MSLKGSKGKNIEKNMIIEYCAKVLGTLDIKIVFHYAVLSGSHLIDPKCILQHDNGPLHKARVINNLIQQQKE